MASPARGSRFPGDATPCVGRTRALLTAAVSATALLVWVIFTLTTAEPLWATDAFDVAQMGRQLVRGEGFTSIQSFPYVLGWLADNGHATDPPWPNVWRSPLPVLLKALAFSLAGATDLAVVLPGALYATATAALLFLLGNRLYGPWAGIVAACMWILSASQLHHSTSGMGETGGAFFVSAVALLLAGAGEARRPLVRSLLLGLVLGLGYLQRSNLLLLVPVVAVVLFLLLGRLRWKGLGVLVVGVALAVSPWLARNALHFGSPTLSLTQHRALIRVATDSDPFFGFEQQSIGTLFREHATAFLPRLDVAWIGEYWRVLLGEEFPWLVPLFLLCGFATWRGRDRGVWLLGAGGFLLTVLVVSRLYPGFLRFYWPFAGLFLVVSVGSVLRLLNRLPGRGALLAPVAAAVFIGLVVGEGWKLERFLAPRHLPPTVHELAELTEPGTLFASNVSWAVSWQAERPSVRFRGDPATFERIERDFGPVGGIFLRGSRTERFEEWLGQSPHADRFQAPRPFAEGTLWLRRP